MTLGASYADFKSSNIEVDQLGPKFGLTWEVWRNVIVRAAYLKALARPLQMEQTIEPTQVAGFNQLFDDVEGSEIEQFGFGVDARLNRSLSIGAEFNKRDLQVPISTLSSDEAVLEDRDEKRYLAYLYWTAADNLGVRLSYEYEQFERAFLPPEELTTQRLPIGFSYHWPTGMFVQAVGTYVDQEITQLSVSDREDFWNVDATLGYRFPRQLGKAELIMKNLLDEEFRYYDLNFQSREPLPPQFQPERQIFARLTINF
jgi:hypothetical protein